MNLTAMDELFKKSATELESEIKQNEEKIAELDAERRKLLTDSLGRPVDNLVNEVIGPAPTDDATAPPPSTTATATAPGPSFCLVVRKSTIDGSGVVSLNELIYLVSAISRFSNISSLSSISMAN